MQINIPYKKIIILIAVIGVIFIIIDLARNSVKCDRGKTIYRYIPRSFKEEQEEPVFVTDVFKTMFSQPGVWEAGLGARMEEDRKVEELNKFFISSF